MSSTMYRGALTLALAVAAGGCSMQKGTAEAAIAAADSTLQVVALEAEAYVPEQYAAAGATIAAAQSDFDGGNFADALTKAQEASAQVSALGPAIEARKAELTAVWEGMNTTLPATVQAIQARIDELGKMRRLPAGVTQETVGAAATALQEMSTTWAQALEAHGQGNLAGATNLGTDIQAKAGQVMTSLGIPAKQ